MFFFFNDTATTEIYTLSLHDALPIFPADDRGCGAARVVRHSVDVHRGPACTDPRDRKSTRLNSSHANISYAVFCLKKNKSYSSLVFSFVTHIPAIILLHLNTYRIYPS